MTAATAPGTLRKAWYLASLLPVRPREVLDRIAGLLEVRRDHATPHTATYETIPWEAMLAGVEQGLGRAVAVHLDEPALREIEQEVREATARIGPDAPFPVVFGADVTLARLAYALTRALVPRMVIETGVAYGVTSSFVLRALAENGHGTLHSIDLPILRPGADDYVGMLVPPRLRARWRLHRGASRRVLPTLVPRVAPVDLFIHDSLHTYETMRAECATVGPYLARPAAVLADDIHGNAAFAEWSRSLGARSWSAAVQESVKHGLFGVATLAGRDDGDRARA